MDNAEQKVTTQMYDNFDDLTTLNKLKEIAEQHVKLIGDRINIITQDNDYKDLTDVLVEKHRGFFIEHEVSKSIARAVHDGLWFAFGGGHRSGSDEKISRIVDRLVAAVMNKRGYTITHK